MKKLLFLLILTLICIFINITTHAVDIVTDGLVGYWSFDRNTIDDDIVQDIWGENDAIIKGNPKIADGHIRQALQLDGVGDYVILDNVGNFQTRIAPFSFEFMVNITHNDRPFTIFKVYDGVCGKEEIGWGIDINTAIKPPNFQQGIPLDEIPKHETTHRRDSILVQHANSKKIGCSSFSRTFSFPFSDGKWHHFVFVSGARYLDAEGKMWNTKYLYIDNVRILLYRSRGTSPENLVPYTQPIYLGATNNNGKAQRSYLRGSIDEVRVYDRALTHNEITKNYATTTGLSVEPVHKLPMVWGKLKSRR